MRQLVWCLLAAAFILPNSCLGSDDVEIAKPNDAPHDEHAGARPVIQLPAAPQAKEGDGKDPLAGLSERERQIVQHQAQQEKFRKEHAGHAKMHAEMLLVLRGTMIASQIALVYWKKFYFNSYQSITLVGMWVIPIYFSIELHFYRMIWFWALFSLVTAYVTYKATRKPLQSSTPRYVYGYFAVLYKLTYWATFFGYFLAIIDFFGMGAVIQRYLHPNKPHPLFNIGMLCMFYGLYFGVLVRDFAEISSASMASVIGYYNKEGITTKTLPKDICAICGEHLKTDEDDPEKIILGPCGNRFHEFCVRGWCIIGKKSTCAYCGEKMDLGKLAPPWSLQRQDVLFSQLLDMIRYLVVWQPVIITTVKIINHALGLS